MEVEDDGGGFRDDRLSKTKNMYDGMENMNAFREPLINDRDVSYLGPVFIGEPFSQTALVVYDTGSDWLTVKSCYTDKHCNKKVPKKSSKGYNKHANFDDIDTDDIKRINHKFL